LTKCPASELEDEFIRSKHELERRLDCSTDTFAYPYGRYSEKLFPLVAKAGYRSAVAVFPNEPTVTSNRYAMRRIYVHAGDGPIKFRLKLSNTYLRYAAWRDRRAISRA